MLKTYRTLCEAGDGSHRALAQSVIRNDLTNFAVWLFNVRHQRELALSLFRFLHTEAEAVGDVENAALNKRNASN